MGRWDMQRNRMTGFPEVVSRRKPGRAKLPMDPVELARREKFVKAVGDGKTPEEAAGIAGYAEPGRAGFALLSIPWVRERVFARLRPKAVGWNELKEQGKEVLKEAMELVVEARLRYGSELGPKDLAAVVNASVGAAGKVFEVLGRSDPDSLTEKAAKEDNEEDLRELALRVLGLAGVTRVAGDAEVGVEAEAEVRIVGSAAAVAGELAGEGGGEVVEGAAGSDAGREGAS